MGPVGFSPLASFLLLLSNLAFEVLPLILFASFGILDPLVLYLMDFILSFHSDSVYN